MSERYQCTPETPWKPEYGTPVSHTNVVEVGEQEDDWYGSSYQRYRCNDCGASWKSELPQ